MRSPVDRGRTAGVDPDRVLRECFEALSARTPVRRVLVAGRDARKRLDRLRVAGSAFEACDARPEDELPCPPEPHDLVIWLASPEPPPARPWEALDSLRRLAGMLLLIELSTGPGAEDRSRSREADADRSALASMLRGAGLGHVYCVRWGAAADALDLWLAARAPFPHAAFEPIGPDRTTRAARAGRSRSSGPLAGARSWLRSLLFESGAKEAREDREGEEADVAVIHRWLERVPEDAFGHGIKFARACRRLLHPYGRPELVPQPLSPDGELLVDLGQDVGCDVFYGLGFEDLLRSTSRDLLQAGDTAIDVGANIGIYTVLASAAVGPLGAVHAFEPASRPFRLLTMNVERNGCSNVRTSRLALGSRAGAAELQVNVESALSSIVPTERGTVSGTETVEMLTLDAYAEQAAIKAMNFLKIDTEGLECDVLEGAWSLIDRSPDLLMVVELSPKNYVGREELPDAILTKLRERGFRALAMSQDGRSAEVPATMSFRAFPRDFLFVRSGSERARKLSAILDELNQAASRKGPQA